MNDWAKTLDNKEQVDSLILNFEKAQLCNRWKNVDKDRLFLVPQTTHCCKRSEVRLASSLVGFPTGHRSLSFVVLVVPRSNNYRRFEIEYEEYVSNICTKANRGEIYIPVPRRK